MEIVPPESAGRDRVSSGVQHLDSILQDGLQPGGTYVVAGPSGAGKTVFANQLCFHHAERGGRAVYITLLTESHGSMIDNLRTLDFFRPERIPEDVYYVSATDVLDERKLPGLLEMIRRLMRSRRATLSVIDGLEVAALYAEGPIGLRKFLMGIHASARFLACTTLLLATEGEPGVQIARVIADGVLELDQRFDEGRATRELTVHKLRGASYIRGRHTIEIGHDGLAVCALPPGARPEGSARRAQRQAARRDR
jgi:circadian clock protein KaiC